MRSAALARFGYGSPVVSAHKQGCVCVCVCVGLCVHAQEGMATPAAIEGTQPYPSASMQSAVLATD